MHPDTQTIVIGYVSLDDLVRPSLRNVLQDTLLEAMACEKAVIGTRAGGIDAVIDCKNGRLVSTNDADELANTIIELLTSEHV